MSSIDWAALRASAQEAAASAYAPYSGLRVGAAGLTVDQRRVTGCNVENASYGLAICAERSAVLQMVAAGEGTFDQIVVYTPTATPTAPCGACRQVLNEFNPDLEVVCVCDGPVEIRLTLRELLPAAFGPANLG